MTKKTGFQLYKHLKAGHISLGTQASDQVGFLDDKFEAFTKVELKNSKVLHS